MSMELLEGAFNATDNSLAFLFGGARFLNFRLWSYSTLFNHRHGIFHF